MVFHFFDKMKDPGSEFGKCVNSVIFSAHSAYVFSYQHIVKALARKYLQWGRNSYAMVEVKKYER